MALVKATIPKQNEVTKMHRSRPLTNARDSGVPWLGDIPNSWTTAPLRRIGWLKAGAGFPDAEQGIQDAEIPFFKVATLADNSLGVFIGEAEHTVTRETARRLGAAVFPPKTIVFAKVGAALLLNRRKLLGRPACIDNNMMGFVATHGESRFIYYHLLDLDFGRFANPGAVPSLNAGDIRDIPLAWPPLEEQKAIAAFLDRETARIDALIAKKQRLIELLQEKRTALISHAVTKGLDPNAPLKSSGIDWLGLVPSHWNIAPLYARCWLELGKMLDAKQITGEYSVPYLRNIDVQWDHINIDDLPEMDIEPHEYRRFILSDGDLLVCEGGEVGRSAIWRCDLPLCAYQKAIHRLRPRSQHDSVKFLYYVFRHAASTGIFVANGNPNTIPHLTGEQLRVYRFPFPPRDEQATIVVHLDEQTKQLDTLTDRIGNGIDRLREYRSALISAAVTGKIDVRGEVS